jgi:PBSX family phage terminase large subunit
MSFSVMQQEYLNNATHRWNVKSGATRSGKTYLDYFVIPKRIRRTASLDGLIVIMGHTKSSIQRNIVEPLQNIWGTNYVSDIKSDNTAYLFGEKVYCLGAEKISQVNKIRGSSIKYCYGDEVVTWHPDVFGMLKSRLDKEYSIFDGTCNPENPKHWFKSFLDSDVDLYKQSYTIDDNPFLPQTVKDNLKKEYYGTVFYDRYILGKWVNAEGLIYPHIADNPDSYLIHKEKLPTLYDFCIGIDFGGNKSGHAIVLSAIGTDGVLYVLKTEYREASGTRAEDIVNWAVRKAEEFYKEYPYFFDIYPDAAEQALKNSIAAKSRFNVYNSLKPPIIDRIRVENRLMGSHRIKFVDKECDELIKALSEALWDDKSLEDKRMDNGTFNNDIIDAFEYSFTYNINFFEEI